MVTIRHVILHRTKYINHPWLVYLVFANVMLKENEKSELSGFMVDLVQYWGWNCLHVILYALLLVTCKYLWLHVNGNLLTTVITKLDNAMLTVYIILDTFQHYYTPQVKKGNCLHYVTMYST